MTNQTDSTTATRPKITAATTDARFLASDEDLRRAEANYADFEADLRQQIRQIPTTYPGYHDYHYSIDPIGHDPYVLAAILSAIKPDFAYDDPEIQAMLKKLRQPRRQYTLTVRTAVAAEYRDRFDSADVDQVAPEYLDVWVRLVNYDLYCTVDSLLTHDQLAAYAGYMHDHGGRPELFPKYQYPHASQLIEPEYYDIPAQVRRGWTNWGCAIVT